MILKKHDINRFYVGELYIGVPLENVQKHPITYMDIKKVEQAKKSKDQAIMNGAIVFEQTTRGIILNWSRMRLFDDPPTLLPSLGFQFPEAITFRQAKAIFTRLFHGRYQYPNDMTTYYHEYDNLGSTPVPLGDQLEEPVSQELTLTKALKLYQSAKR